MLFPDVHPNDIFNSALRKAAVNAIDADEEISAWHGTDEFTEEDVEILLNLTKKNGGMALGRKAYAFTLSEKGPLLLLHFDNTARGIVELDFRKETLPLNLQRTGIEVFNNGREAHLRLYDRLSEEDILVLDGEELHSLVDEKVINPKDYQGSAFSYVKKAGII